MNYIIFIICLFFPIFLIYLFIKEIIFLFSSEKFKKIIEILEESPPHEWIPSYHNQNKFTHDDQSCFFVILDENSTYNDEIWGKRMRCSTFVISDFEERMLCRYFTNKSRKFSKKLK